MVLHSTTQAIYLPYALGAWDHLLARAADPEVEFDPVIVSNSYGVARGARYNPNDPLNVATWEAYRRGMVPVFAAGNDGPDQGTLNRYAKAPHVLSVAATNDSKTITDFSSRGRSDVNRVFHDRDELLGNLRKFHDAMEAGRTVVDDGRYQGELGPGATSPVGGVSQTTAADTYTWAAPDDADLLSFALSLTPDAQQVTVSVFRVEEGGRTLVARMGEEPVYIHRTLATDIAGGGTYEIELEPRNTAAVQYDLDWVAYGKQVSGARDLTNLRPVTLYRPGVSSPGNAIVSTVDPHDVLATSVEAEPFYATMSGTSMACPAAAGVCALVVEAYRKHNDGVDPHPLTVIRALEATADPDDGDYTPANAGTGFVEAPAAVEYVESLRAAEKGQRHRSDRARQQALRRLTR